METTTNLPGIFTFILSIAGALTLIVSIALLWLYRRAILRGMASAAEFGVDNVGTDSDSNKHFVPNEAIAAENIASVLEFVEIGNTLDNASVDSDKNAHLSQHILLSNIRRAQQQTAIVYLIAGFVYALVMSAASITAAGAEFSVVRILMLLTLYLWPTAIALCIVTAVDIKETMMILSAYVVLLAIAMLVVLLRNPDQSLLTLSVLWLIANAIPSVFFLFFLQERLRAVGPIVFAFMICCTTGAFVLLQFAMNSSSVMQAMVNVGHVFGLSAGTLIFLVLVTGFILAAVLVGRVVLKKMGDAYIRKQFSDRSIIVDSLWLMFAIFQCINFLFEGLVWIFAAPFAFIAYRIAVSIGFNRVSSMRLIPDKPMELLLLRVFSLGRRSNRFYDRFSKLWRQVGVINMIAGPDLVTAAIEPHEFLDFTGGKISRQFVVSGNDLDLRLRDLDKQADPDGRYRVHEFFCHDNTWRMTMQSLAMSSDAILMDLRSFSSSNQGCLYELKVLLDTVDLRRIVFVVDQTTDRDFLEKSYLGLWSTLDQRSPNRLCTNPAVRLFNTKAQDRQSMRAIIKHLLIHTQETRGSLSSAATRRPTLRET